MQFECYYFCDRILDRDFCRKWIALVWLLSAEGGAIVQRNKKMKTTYMSNHHLRQMRAESSASAWSHRIGKKISMNFNEFIVDQQVLGFVLPLTTFANRDI